MGSGCLPPPVRNADTPGPGTYDARLKAVAPRERLAVMEEANAPHGAFDSTAPRFISGQEVRRDSPGPGYYTSDKDGVSAGLQVRLQCFSYQPDIVCGRWG